MLSNNMPADNTAGEQRRRELWQIEAMRRKWQAGIQPVSFMVVLRYCLLMTGLLTGFYSLQGPAWFFIIVFVLVSIAIALPNSPSWPERIDRALQAYQPSDPGAFRRLQCAAIENGELNPDMLRVWLQDEFQSVNGYLKKKHNTFTSRIIQDEEKPHP